MLLKADGGRVELKLSKAVDILLTVNPNTQELCIVVPDASVSQVLGGLRGAINQADLRRHMTRTETVDESDTEDDKPDPFAKHHSISPLCKEVVYFAEVLR